MPTRSEEKSEIWSENSDFKARLSSITNEDERRLLALGYRQEVKRIFSEFTNFGLAASMISILLGVIPLYTYEMQTGGPVVLFWTWVVAGFFTIILVSALGEICSAFPTMGALYYWAFRLGGEKWGPFASWIAGWCNLLGQIAGVASGGFAGAQVIAEIINLTSGKVASKGEIILLYAAMLAVAGVVNTFAETLLTALCYISVAWQIVGTIVIVVGMLSTAPRLQTAEFVFFHFNNETNFTSVAYVALIGALAAASTFTGYDTAAHVAEETTNSHNSTPKAMLYSVINAIFLGWILIAGMNFCIQDMSSLVVLNADDDGGGVNQAYTILWMQTVGKSGAIGFLFITLIAIECSNCANLTSAARMLYSFARDGALPLSRVWYHIDPNLGGPVRSIWLSLVIAFLLGLPGLTNPTVLGALFSLTATGLYSSYIIPIFLRVTVARETFQPAEFNLGQYSVPAGVVAVAWGAFMTIVLCLPQATPTNINNINYSPVALGAVLLYAILSWHLSAKKWFKIISLEKRILHSNSFSVNVGDFRLSFGEPIDPNHPTESSHRTSTSTATTALARTGGWPPKSAATSTTTSHSSAIPSPLAAEIASIETATTTSSSPATSPSVRSPYNSTDSVANSAYQSPAPSRDSTRLSTFNGLFGRKSSTRLSLTSHAKAEEARMSELQMPNINFPSSRAISLDEESKDHVEL